MGNIYLRKTKYNDTFKKELQLFSDEKEETALIHYPVLYIIYNSKQKAYIGETNSIVRRTQEHLKQDKDYFKNLDTMLVVGQEEFNKSATVNFETRLISLFLADGYHLFNTKQTQQLVTNDYYQKHYYNNEIFSRVWDKLKDEEKLVSHSIAELENTDIFKLSPFKALSESQMDLKEKVITFIEKSFNGKNPHSVFLVRGDAGVGKSVVLSSIFNELQNRSEFSNSSNDPLYKTKNYIIVNHEQMIKQYKNLAAGLNNMKKNQIQRPTSFINEVDKGKKEPADVVLVDEAHLLLTETDSYYKFNYSNQLREIIERSKVTVLFFDPAQFVKLKSYWSTEDVRRIVGEYENAEYHLTEQFRVRADKEVINWIDNFSAGKIGPAPRDEKYDFQIFDDALEMKRVIDEKNNEFHLSRLVATYDYDYSPSKANSKNGDGEVYKVKAGDLVLPWNTTTDSTAWAERDDTINEVGSIYTVQGADLNYVGVILGPSITYDEELDRIDILLDKFKDKGALKTRNKSVNNDELKKQLVLNSINVLIKRGIHGLYLYAADEKLRKKLLSI